MVTDDGTYAHQPQPGARQQYKKTTHYDRVWGVLDGTGVKMIGDHYVKGGRYTFVDGAGTLVGEVNFGPKDEFVAGKFYGELCVRGRTQNASQAISSFIDMIEETHAKRR